MGNGSCVFDLLDGNACSLQSGDRRLAARSRTFDPNLDLLDAKLRCLFGCLLSGHLTGKRRALSRTLEVARSGTCPAKGISTGVGDRHMRIVEGRFDESDRTGDISSCLAPFVRRILVDLLLCHN